jgi:DNA-directed RNA polymerase subunit RPC12/RpoP
MSEFKYACPVCGQHIKCDSSHSGSVMECPTCFQKITVPQAPATEDPKFILTGTQAGKRRFPAAPVTSGPTAPPSKKSLMPGIAFVILLCALVAAAFVFRGTHFQSAPAGTNAGNNTSPAGTPSGRAPGNPTATVLGCRVEADDVVFVFEPAAFGVSIAPDARVYVAGNFNRWLDASDGKIRNPAPAWQMQRVASGGYELHKPVADFQGRPQWEFKFVVNLSQWIEVPGTALNRTTGQPVNLTLTIPEKPGAPPD